MIHKQFVVYRSNSQGMERRIVGTPLNTEAEANAAAIQYATDNPGTIPHVTSKMWIPYIYEVVPVYRNIA